MTDPALAVPTPEQQEAIEHPQSPLLVVAGAGTGKTWVMARRILHLVQSGSVRADQILGLTFTNKAASNLEEQVRCELGDDTDIAIGTYHSFGAGLVADHHVELGLAPRTRVLNRAQAWMLLFGVFDEFRFEKRSSYVPGGVVNEALQLGSRAADHLITVASLLADCDDVALNGRWKPMREMAVKRRELCQVIEAYARRKRERGFIDFSDQITMAVDLVLEYPDVAAALREQWPVVLLDEYQDTNYAQRVLLQTIWPDAPAITAVGDDMQSIYGFRGAHLANIMGFPDHFAPCEVKRLETNRRSGRSVVDLANRIQAMVPGALAKSLGALEGAADTVIECFVAADDAEEAQLLAAEIAARGAPWSDNAILCRKRRLIPAIVDALEAAGVPVDEVGGGGLSLRPEIVDLVAWLEILAKPVASVALLRILEGPRYRVGRTDLAALGRHTRVLEATSPRATLADAVHDHTAAGGVSPAGHARLAAFERDRAGLVADAARLSVLDLCETVSQRAGLWAGTGEKARENLLRFFALAAEFAPVDGEPGLLAFVEYLTLLEESEETFAEARTTDLDAVRVMTIHQAKGLEFPNVYVVGLAGATGAGIFPDTRSAENGITNSSALPYWIRPDHDDLPDWHTATQTAITDKIKARQLAEEWRLLYVACTRAKRRLVCSAAQWYPGRSTPHQPSAFYDFIAAQSDLVVERFRHDPPAVDPAFAARQARFGQGRGSALQPVTDDPADATPGLIAVPPPPSLARPRPTTLSVTDLVSHVRCPRQFFWSAVRPLPRRHSPAARLGTEVHRVIEQRADRQLVLLDPDEILDTDTAEDESTASIDAATPTGGDPARGYLRSFDLSVFAELDPLMVEAPFEMAVGPVVLRGRIDAVYERDGRLELVDFKTGRLPEADDPSHWTQVSVYALAAARLFGRPATSLRSTYCRLQIDAEPVVESVDWTQELLDAFDASLAARCAGFDADAYPTTPGAWCDVCSFAAVCPAAPG